MCEPTLLLAAATATKFIGQMQQASAARRAASDNRAIGEYNASIREVEARDALDRGKVAETNKRRETASILARQEAVAAASGLLSTTGSSADLLADTAYFGALDAETIRHNSRNEAERFKRDAYNTRFASQSRSAELKSKARGHTFNAIGSLLTGGAAIQHSRGVGK